MRTGFHDVRFAIRTFLKDPAISSLAVLCLALAISVNSAVFSLVDGYGMRPLPIERPDEVVNIYTSIQGRPDRLSYQDYLDFRSQSKTLAGLLAEVRFGPVLSGDGQSEPTMTTVASENFFSVLGVKAAIGRVFTEEDRDRNEPVLVMSYGLWQRRYGGDPNLVGKSVVLGARSFTVIGIAPRAFQGTAHGLDIDLWVPLASWGRGARRGAALFAGRGNRQFDVMGRLRPGVTIDQARAELEGIARNLEQAYPDTNKYCGASVVSPREQMGRTPYILLGIVGLVLLIACVNVANLLLARAEVRRREIAIRLAIGASRGRLVRQLLTESLLLGAISTAVALLFARWMIHLLPSVLIAPSTHRSGYQFLLDGRVLAFTLLSSAATVVVFGLFPAVNASRPDLVSALKSETGGAGGRRRILLRDVLVVVQVTLSVVALACAGLLMRAYVAGLKLDLGFQRKDLLLVKIYSPYRPPQARAFFTELGDRVRAIPGVRQVTTATRPPMWLSEGGISASVSVPGYTGPDGASSFRIKDQVIGLNYFRTFGTRLLQGRDFSERDTETGAKVVIVNETMARQFWPLESPIGKLIRIGEKEAGEDREIVGVVQDTKINHPDERPEPYLYRPFAQTNQTYMTLIVEAAGDPMRYGAAVRAEVAAIDKRVMIYEVWTMRGLVRHRFFDREAPATVVGTLGLLGLMLAAVGLYGVVSYSAARRTREIGIRMALGADRGDAVSLVLWHGLRLTLIGVAVGIVAAAAVTPLLRHMLYGVSPRDPIALIGVVLVMVVVSLAASFFPARKATKIEPVTALRYE